MKNSAGTGLWIRIDNQEVLREADQHYTLSSAVMKELKKNNLGGAKDIMDADDAQKIEEIYEVQKKLIQDQVEADMNELQKKLGKQKVTKLMSTKHLEIFDGELDKSINRRNVGMYNAIKDANANGNVAMAMLGNTHMKDLEIILGDDNIVTITGSQFKEQYSTDA